MALLHLPPAKPCAGRTREAGGAHRGCPRGRPLAPSSRFWLGTDLLGRDLLTRLLYGARISLLIGLLANGAALTIGTFFGAVAGYFRGWVSTAFMRLTDMMMAFPALILAIA